MPRVDRPLFPVEERRTTELGERIRLARLRRRIPLVELAQRIGVSRPTLLRLERGDAGVSLAVLVRVLSVLGLLDDLQKIAGDDELGQRLQDVSLRRPRRAARAVDPGG